jgi:hypothetical protein
MADADTAEFLKRGGTEALAEHALAAVRRALEGGSEPLGPWPSAPNLSLEEHVSGLASALARYATHRRAGSDKEGRAALSLAAQHFHRLHWPHPAWRGTNLGGLLLLEPGPAHPFFEDTARALFPGGNGSVGGCEWALCEAIDQAPRDPTRPRRALIAAPRARPPRHDARPFPRAAGACDDGAL